MNMNITQLKIALLCRGLKIDPNLALVPSQYPTHGKSRAGVAGSAKNFILEYGEACKIGVLQPFLQESPYKFKIIDNKGWILKNDEKIIRTIIKEPKWHSTDLLNKIQLHGNNSLATALSNFCIYKKGGEGCKFCIIDVGKNFITHKPEEIAKAIKEIERNKELRAFNDIVDKYNPNLSKEDLEKRKGYIEPKDININSGTLKDKGVKLHKRTIFAIRKISKLPIGIQLCPIEKKEIKELHSIGADEISFNLEVYDQKARKEVIPGKAKDNPRDKYFQAMEEAVSIFGKNQVESWILIGLEPKEKTIEAIEKIAEKGAIPLPKPFRPLFGAKYENKRPPSIEDAVEIYKAWLEIIKHHKLNPLETKAGCGRCNACFPLKELIRYGI